jgi:nickel/cobalt transporter (NiCoT) family protein
MHDLPTEWTAVAALVFLLGLKHGFDADHLATIDGLTRLNARHRHPWARYCGALFSLGHGAVVMLIALTVGYATERWQTPDWLEVSGTLISLAVLLGLGVINLYAVLRTPPHEVVTPVGFKGRFLGRLNQVQHPALIALVGALFALSFDTVSQAALFAVAGTQFGGVEHALILGVLFTLGMLVTDGINGLWISRLIARADQIALIASRVMSLAVAGVSLLVAGLGLAKMTWPLVDTWSEGKELFFGLTVIALLLASFAVARTLARRPQVI